MLTHQQNLEAVRQACIKANPEIVELNKQMDHFLGCINYAKSPIDADAARFMNEQLGKFRPIRLADVLLASKGLIHDIENDGEKLRTYKLHNDGKHDLQVFWNLRKDSLDEQEEETVSFLYELLK